MVVAVASGAFDASLAFCSPGDFCYVYTKVANPLPQIMRLTKSKSLISIPMLLALPSLSTAGPAAYGICQAGCAGVVVACYGAAGFTFGTVLAAAAPPAIAACNGAYGSCQAACAGVLLAPTP
ncbi:hypothetical protein IWZ03DRAFT_359704 [Phyllosticta citriasiana]|uniref:Zygote-specific protein n=1 Tax=Phyllosticta citriasiana TaxID=595635 RepID=A0ABR1KMB2_9PEZI